MKVIVDEHIPLMTVKALLDLGHDVLDLRGTPAEGMDDDRLWELAQSEKRLLVTTDKGFLRFRSVLHHGLLVVRLRRPNRDRIHNRIIEALGEHGTDDWTGLSVVMRDVARSHWRVSDGP